MRTRGTGGKRANEDYILDILIPIDSYIKMCPSFCLSIHNRSHFKTPSIALEAISKPHLSPDGCVEGLFKMLTYSPCMLRFIIGPRLALERDLRL
jgi:hypothetical protein